MGKYNIIKINENSIRQIVETCVKSILRENDMDEFKGRYVYENKSSKKLINETHVYDELDEIHKRLNNIMNSGYIPFASPSPSSTELEIKNAIIDAARSIDKAMYLDGQCYGSNPIAHVC